MKAEAIILEIVLLGWILFFIRSAYQAIATRVSPKYAIKRKLREQQRSDKAALKRRLRRERREAKGDRLTNWANKNPDDETAKAYLARETAPVLAQALTQAEFNPQAELRRRQHEADEMQRRITARQELEKRRLLELHDWALKHPDIPEARRHLNEALESVSERLEKAERDVQHYQHMMSYEQDENSPESIMYATRLSEAKTNKADEERFMHEIQAALGMSAPALDEQ